jgi:hypothetical protein
MSKTDVLLLLAHTFESGRSPSLHRRPDARLLASSAQSINAEPGDLSLFFVSLTLQTPSRTREWNN